MTLTPPEVVLGLAVPSVRAEPLDRLPGSSTDDPFLRLAAGWLVGHPSNTATAYRRDLEAWARWCTQLGVHPLAAERHHVGLWVRHLATQPQPRTGRPGHSRPEAARAVRVLRLPARLRPARPTVPRRRPPRRRHPAQLPPLCATESLRLGAALQDVQDALGHADPRTTRGYDRSRHNLDRSPNYLLAAALTVISGKDPDDAPRAPLD